MKMTEISGPSKIVYSRFQRIIKPIGKEFRFVRLLYWKLSGRTYLWGMYQFYVDSYNSKWFEEESAE